jgi:uncharacterized protein YjdB
VRAQYYQCTAILLALALSACGGSSPSAPSATPAATPTPYITFSGPQALAPGQSAQLTASETPATGPPSDVTTLAQWSSSDSSIANVSNTGVVKAIAPGTSTITATYQSVSSTWVLSVTASNLVASVLVTGSPSIGTKEGTQLVAIATLLGGSGTQDVTTLAAWQSSNPAIAAVSNSGIVTAVAPGTATITARYMGVQGSWTVAVVDAVSSVLVLGSTSIATGTTTPTQLTAAAVMAIGPERAVTGVAAWDTSDATVATVSGTGQVTGVAAGTATITATYNGVSGSVDVMVH